MSIAVTGAKLDTGVRSVNITVQTHQRNVMNVVMMGKA